MSDAHGGRSPHLYDSISAQKHTVVDSFTDQREVLKRAVTEQRLAAMPDEMTRVITRMSTGDLQALNQGFTALAAAMRAEHESNADRTARDGTGAAANRGTR